MAAIEPVKIQAIQPILGHAVLNTDRLSCRTTNPTQRMVSLEYETSRHVSSLNGVLVEIILFKFKTSCSSARDGATRMDMTLSVQGTTQKTTHR